MYIQQLGLCKDELQLAFLVYGRYFGRGRFISLMYSAGIFTKLYCYNKLLAFRFNMAKEACSNYVLQLSKLTSILKNFTFIKIPLFC